MVNDVTSKLILAGILPLSERKSGSPSWPAILETFRGDVSVNGAAATVMRGIPPVRSQVLPPASRFGKHRLSGILTVLLRRALQNQSELMSSDQLANIMFGSVFLFIGLAACAFAAIRRGGGVRLFAWLGIWSAMRGVRLLAKSPPVVAVLPHWLQVCAPFVWVATMYLVLPVAVLAWLELTVGKVRPFLKTVIVISRSFDPVTAN